jgi:hypothetical protein
MDQRPQDLAEVAEHSATTQQFSIAWREFLDRFYLSPSATALQATPALLRDALGDEGYADAFLAAMAAELARRHHLPVPPWTTAPERYLRDPHFALKSRKNWALLLQDSPAEFRARRIFVSANVLDRA